MKYLIVFGSLCLEWGIPLMLTGAVMLMLGIAIAVVVK